MMGIVFNGNLSVVFCDLIVSLTVGLLMNTYCLPYWWILGSKRNKNSLYIKKAKCVTCLSWGLRNTHIFIIMNIIKTTNLNSVNGGGVFYKYRWWDMLQFKTRWFKKQNTTTPSVWFLKKYLIPRNKHILSKALNQTITPT